jgi:hypothetical protein
MLKKSLRKFINKVNPIQKRKIRGIKKEVNPDQSLLLDIEKKKKEIDHDQDLKKQEGRLLKK